MIVQYKNILELILFRLVGCIFSCTWFVPDEHFQSVEIAYRMVYGIGHTTWEWDPNWALRTTLHPLLYAIPFSILRAIGADFGWALRWTPQIVHALLFAMADACYMRWLRRLGLSYKTFNLTLALYFSNWFILYCVIRTLSNTLECCLTLIALNWYEEGKKAADEERMLTKAGICMLFVTLVTITRPTSTLLWIPLCMAHFLENCRNSSNQFDVRKAAKYIFRVSPYILSVFTLAFLLDSLYYGKATFSLWNFFKFNVLDGGSAHFGTHPWHWYFTQGLPPILGLSMYPALITALNLRKNLVKCITRKISNRYIVSVCVYLTVHSLILHKEHRFILPVIPFLLPSIASEINSHLKGAGVHGKIMGFLKCAIPLSNIIAVIYFGLVHQRGPYAANLQILEFIEQSLPNEKISILQLMPCYSMPMYAGLHPYANRTQIRMLDCGLQFTKINQTIYAELNDESDAFHDDPKGWLNRNWFKERLYQNNLIITYEHIHRQIEAFLMQKGFRRRALILHTIFTSSTRQDQKIVISSLSALNR